MCASQIIEMNVVEKWKARRKSDLICSLQMNNKHTLFALRGPEIVCYILCFSRGRVYMSQLNVIEHLNTLFFCTVVAVKIHRKTHMTHMKE